MSRWSVNRLKKIKTMEFMIIIGLAIGLLLLIRTGKKYNKTDWGSNGLNILDGINRWFCLRYHRLSPELISLPEQGPVILVANHVSGLDPLLLIAATTRPLRFMVAQEEYRRWWLNWLLKKVGCIPVNRSRTSKSTLGNSLAVLQQSEVLAIFPQGRIVKNDADRTLKKGAFRLAMEAKVPIHCVHVEGVKAQGFTALAVVVRSKIKLTAADQPVIVEPALFAHAREQVQGKIFAES